MDVMTKLPVCYVIVVLKALESKKINSTMYVNVASIMVAIITKWSLVQRFVQGRQCDITAGKNTLGFNTYVLKFSSLETAASSSYMFYGTTFKPHT